MSVREKLEKIKTESDNGKATKKQIAGALYVLSGKTWNVRTGLFLIGFDEDVDEIATTGDWANSLAITVLTCAFLDIEIGELDPDDEW